MRTPDSISRRTALAIGGAAAVGVTVGASSGVAAERLLGSNTAATADGAKDKYNFFGEHQTGIAEPAQAFATLIAYRLLPETDASAIGRLLRLWTSDISLLMDGRGAMADSNAEIAATTAGLTITVGLGFEPFVRAQKEYEWPLAAIEVPAYKKIDKLEPQWVGGDLFLQVCANDALTVAHAVRELTKSALPFAKVHWQQRGFSTPPNINPGSTPRNLMGQIDGSANPKPSSPEFDYTVWNPGERHPWFKGGTTVAVRRIRMQLDTWEKLKPPDQELVIGRNRRNGAPLTGRQEKDTADFNAKDAAGEFVIPKDAHMRRASFEEKIFRRGFSYSDGFLEDGSEDHGLLFVTYQSELQQYFQIQSSLADLDSLNKWTVPVGSAVFAILPGCESGDYLGSAVF
jgi:dye decolorizing peroxidase